MLFFFRCYFVLFSICKSLELVALRFYGHSQAWPKKKMAVRGNFLAILRRWSWCDEIAPQRKTRITIMRRSLRVLVAGIWHEKNVRFGEGRSADTRNIYKQWTQRGEALWEEWSKASRSLGAVCNSQYDRCALRIHFPPEPTQFSVSTCRVCVLRSPVLVAGNATAAPLANFVFVTHSPTKSFVLQIITSKRSCIAR